MKPHPFPIGALIVNAGRLRGQGYIWRVEGYEPSWAGDHYDYSKMNVVCKNIGPLHGQPERGDHAIGQTYHYDPATKELLGAVKPAYQMSLI